MAVQVVRIRIVGVGMRHVGMMVSMAMAHTGCNGLLVPVCMVIVAHPVLVFVLVFHRGMRMGMFMAFGQVQNHPDCHQNTAQHQSVG